MALADLSLPVIPSSSSDSFTLSKSNKLSMSDKDQALKEILIGLKSVVVGFSGGVDSALLLTIAVEVLGVNNVLAVIGISETYPEREQRAAMRFAESIGVRYETVRTEETDQLKFRENPANRCYFCKSELYDKLEIIRQKHAFAFVLDGTNADDTKEYRPGLRALNEKNVRSPLAEAGLTKTEIRILSTNRNLSTAEKPSFACLSSRFPYGMSIDKDKLSRVDRAENILYDLGFTTVRVRFHDENTARIELAPNELERAVHPEMREILLTNFRELGFTYITLDLQGFRSGSMNEVLTSEVKMLNMQV